MSRECTVAKCDVNSLTPKEIPPLLFFKNGETYATAHTVDYAVKIINELFNEDPANFKTGKILMIRVPSTNTRKNGIRIAATLHFVTSAKTQQQSEFYTIGDGFSAGQQDLKNRYTSEEAKAVFINKVIDIHKSAYKKH